MRVGLVAVDPGQVEPVRSLGLNYMTTMVVIIIPQAIRAVLPALGNEFIVLLKDTSLITTIGGIVGKIVMVNPNTIVIETSDDRVRMELTKWAVSQVGVQTGEQPEAEKKEKKAEKKEETPAVEAPKADEDEKN